MLVQALKAAGDNPTRASTLAALSSMHEFTANGLYGAHTLDPNNRSDYVSGVDNCQYFVQMKGGKFELVDGAEPLCGHIIPGKTVA
jgi:hypothetical protein